MYSNQKVKIFALEGIGEDYAYPHASTQNLPNIALQAMEVFGCKLARKYLVEVVFANTDV